MRAAIVGLPQSGKTTLFNALTGAHGDVGAYHAGAQVSVSTVRVPDERLDALARMLAPKEVVAATIEFEDIGGVFAHLAGGERQGQAVAALRGADAVLMVLRCFQAPHVVEVLGGIDPVREHGAMREELLLADLEVIEHRLEAVARDVRKASPERDALLHEQGLLERCRQAIEGEEGLRAVGMSPQEEKLLRSYAFLTLKPRLCILNIGEGQMPAPPQFPELDPPPVAVCAEFEMELMDLEEDERAAFMAESGLEELATGRVIRACYDALELRSFFTHVSEKLRAWTVPAGTDARSAAGRIHTDMEKGFIRAEVVSFGDLAACGSLKDARAAGKVRMEGRDYAVQDGDVITYHFTR